MNPPPKLPFDACLLVTNVAILRFDRVIAMGSRRCIVVFVGGFVGVGISTDCRSMMIGNGRYKEIHTTTNNQIKNEK